MDYTQGEFGRIFIARLHEGEDIYEKIEGLCTAEGVAAGVCFAVGGIARGKVVVGPEEKSFPLKPIYREFDDAREMIGFGTIFADDDGPKMHMHAGIGREDNPIVGCPRGGAEVFLILEVVVMEIKGVATRRELERASGLRLLSIRDKTI